LAAGEDIEEHSMSEETVPQIAVVGLAARYPGARTVDELWRNLRGGVESISYFSAEEMAAAGVDPRLLADPNYVRAKGVLPDADLFDAAFFGFTPREAELMDPQHRVFLEAAWAALEDAGCDPQRSGERVGVFAGSGASSYLISNLLPHREMAEAAGVLQLLLLNDRDFLATRTSYKLGLTGPSVAVQTACSTSLVAIHLACQSLLTGECDLVLAGGVSVSTPLTGGYLYQEGSILSPDGHCRAFDAGAAGSVEANGCGVVVLKRLADAQADGDHIYAVVRGSAVTNDGPARVGFTAPGVDGQAAAISEALLVADVDPDSIGYVETHGSGTALGDPIEMEALTRAFRRAGARRTGACAVGSIKTHLGHCSAGSGVAGFLSAVLALAHRTLPPTLHYQSPSPRIDFATSPFYVCNTATPWESEDGPRRAGVSSFGLGGTNVHVVLEEAPPTEPGEPASREPQILVLSARTPEALDLATERLREHLGQNPSPPDPIGANFAHLEQAPEGRSTVARDGNPGWQRPTASFPPGVPTPGYRESPLRGSKLAPIGPGGEGLLADIAWTLQTGRRGFEHRRFVVARDPESALAALGDPARLVTGRSEADGRRPVVFLFPGLGDQAVDMAREIYASEAVFREQVDLCAAKLQPLLGCDLRDVLFSAGDWSPAVNSSQAPDLRALLRREPSGATQLDQTAFAQPACFVVEYALARQLMDWGIEPEAMIGYSIGEYVAACLAGVLSLDDALTLVARRAQLIQALPSGAMLAVPLTEDEVRPLLGGRLSIAATNGPHFCVVSGPDDAVAEIEQLLAGRGASCLRLQTTHAFHSSMMEPAVAELTELARGIATQAPRIPYLSNVTGTWITPEDLADPAYWALHMQGTVRFAEGLDELLRESGRAYVEVGPGGTLVTLLRQHPNAANAPVAVPTLRRTGGSGSDLDDLLLAAGRLWASGAPLDWERFHGGARRCRVSLPTYPFERRRFWIDPPRAQSSSAREIAAEPLRTLDLDDWFWVPSWKQVPLVRSSVSGAETGSWLIFLDRQGFGERLAGRLRTAGHAVTTVVPGGELADLGSGAFAIHPGRRQDYDALLQRLRAAGDLPERILHLWSVTAEEPSFAEAQTSGLLSLVLLAQALAGDSSEDSQVRVTLVANGLSELDGGPLHPAKATALGALRIVHQEMPRLACGGLLIALPAPGSPQENLLIDQIRAELQAPAAEPLVAFHAGQRWLRSVEPVRLPEAESSLLVAEGVYLVVGDEHGPAVPLAEHLLHLGARVALVLPHHPRKADDRLLLLEAGPGDAAGLRAALDRTRATLGPVRGAFHAPGFTGGLIQWKTLDGLRSALEPAAHGVLALLTAAGEEQPPLDFVVLSSSTFTTTGGLGQLETAAAGAFLDALSMERSTRGGPLTLSVAWDPFQWDGWLAATATGVTGLGSQAIEKSLESYRVAPAQSGEALRRLLAYGLPRAIVSARDLRALIAETEAATAEALRVQETGHQGPRAPRPELSIPYMAPRTEIESRMAGIWEELFGIEPIGVEDSFLELGGHSLLAIQIMTHLRSAFDVELPVTAIFETPTVAGLASAVAQQRDGETEEDLELLALIESLSAEEVAERLGEPAELSEPSERSRPPQPRQPPPVLPRSGPAGIGDWPLSFDQERLLQLHLDNPELVSWNVDAGTRILGPLQVPDLLAAFAAVVRRHAAWRTTFPVIDGQRVQRVSPWIAPHVSVIDLTGLPEEMREPTAHETLFERTRDVYDLEHGPLVRIALARLGEREHLCLIGVHHLITDWITFQVCWRELLTFYEARRGGRTAPLPPLPVQYPDFVLWEREWLQGDVLEESAEFWRHRLADFPLALELPTDHPRPPVQSQRGGLYRVQAGAERTDRLRNLARREGVTMFMAVMAVLDALLHRFSGKDKIIVGSNSANRARQELEQVFGLFLTQIPFPINLSGDPTFRELLARVRQSALASYSHQNFPFSKLIEALGVEPDPQRNPVVQVLLLVLEGQSQMHAGDLDFHGVPLFDGSTRWDLTFGLYDYHDIGLAGPLEYNADIFEDATIGRLLELFYRLIDAVTADPEIRLSQLPAFGEALPDASGISLPEEIVEEVGGLR
jgi:acyl transferase domain-containing protein